MHLILIAATLFNSDDPYEVLGLSHKATPFEIKKAYQRLAMRYHPDRNRGSADVYCQIKAAYELLSSPTDKNFYDTCGFRPPAAKDVEAQATLCIRETMQMVIQELYGAGADQRDHRRTWTIDPIEVVTKSLRDRRTNNTRDVETLKKRIKRMQKAAGKFSYTKGVPFKETPVGSYMEAYTLACRRELANKMFDNRVLSLAASKAADYDFEPDEELDDFSGDGSMEGMYPKGRWAGFYRQNQEGT